MRFEGEFKQGKISGRGRCTGKRLCYVALPVYVMLY